LDAARTQNLPGMVLDERGRLAEAEAAYHRCIDFAQRLADDFPRVPTYRITLAAAQGNLANTLDRAGRVTDAEHFYFGCRRSVGIGQGIAWESLPARTSPAGR